MKTIGTPSAAPKPEIVPSLFVLNSRGATLQGDTLTLTGVTPSSIIFADRPIRSAGHQPTADVIAEWGSGDDSFTKNPPNATVSVLNKDGSVKDAVVKNPKLEGDKLTFNVQTLEGDLAGADGAGALFIDIIGRPFTPMSFAGVARRSAFRGAMYAPPRMERLLMLRLTPHRTPTPARLAAITLIRLATETNEDTGRQTLPRVQSTGSLSIRDLANKNITDEEPAPC
jgi:hypothetical protein